MNKYGKYYGESPFLHQHQLNPYSGRIWKKIFLAILRRYTFCMENTGFEAI